MIQDDMDRMAAIPRLFQEVQWQLTGEFKLAAGESHSEAAHYLVSWVASTRLNSYQMQRFLEYMLWSASTGKGTIEEAARIASKSPGVGDAIRAAFKRREQEEQESAAKRKAAGQPLMGRKTPFMQKQLKEFNKYLGRMGYRGDASRLYALARQCWIANQAEWDTAMSASGTRRGYSCPKAMADAYKALEPARRKSL